MMSPDSLRASRVRPSGSARLNLARARYPGSCVNFTSGLTRCCAWVCMCLAVLQIGCSEQQSVRRYRIPKPPHRMLAAISIQGSDAWFFKVTGDRQELASSKDDFEAFLKSVKLPGSAGSTAGSAKPTWALPSGWKEAATSAGERVATIEIPGKEKPFELTVTRLPVPQRSVDTYTKDNINRWRTQLRLGPITPDAWQKETRELLDATGNKLTVVDFVGTLAPPRQRPGGSAMGGMAGMGRPGAGDMAGNPAGDGPPDRDLPPGGEAGGGRGRGAGGPPDGVAAADLPFTFSAPSEWQSAPVGPFAKLTYRVSQDGQAGEITVSSLSAAANDLLANVNRWRGQIQLAPLTPADLASQVRSIELGSVQGSYMELNGAETSGQSILGAIAVHGDAAWFFKFKGPASLVAKERERFEMFMKSVRFKSL